MPAVGDKSCELIIAGYEGDARLYFVDGQLVHSVMGEMTGPQVIQEILGWNEGEFEFRDTVAVEEIPFEVDLHRAMLTALRTNGDGVPDDDPLVESKDLVRKHLGDFVAENDLVRQVCLVTRDGHISVGADSMGKADSCMDDFHDPLLDFATAYPHKGLGRIILEDDLQTVAVTFLRQGPVLILAADKTARLGAVTLYADRLVRILKENGVR